MKNDLFEVGLIVIKLTNLDRLYNTTKNTDQFRTE